MSTTDSGHHGRNIEENKALVRRVIEHLNQGDIDAFMACYAAGIVDHNAAPDQAPGRTGLRQALLQFHKAFPDLTYTLEEMIAEGDRVATHGTIRATYKGELFGMAPTGKVVTIKAINIWRIAGGELVEWWHSADLLGLMHQVGLTPMPQYV